MAVPWSVWDQCHLSQLLELLKFSARSPGWHLSAAAAGIVVGGAGLGRSRPAWKQPTSGSAHVNGARGVVSTVVLENEVLRYLEKA